MSVKVQIPPDVKINAINELRGIVPPGSWVLFTPHDGLIVSPDPMEIARTLVTLQVVSENALNGSGKNEPAGLMGGNHK